ncbi:MAG: hypothetical protein NXI23_14550 [Bacteroidetes bacterium]|jgi:hypothetical protein|nr:hypothetical protein [Bacteroidota bacterium]MDF1863620.1 hypothetical protein [Saprospiraceae bacterium]
MKRQAKTQTKTEKRTIKLPDSLVFRLKTRSAKMEILQSEINQLQALNEEAITSFLEGQFEHQLDSQSIPKSTELSFNLETNEITFSPTLKK